MTRLFADGPAISRPTARAIVLEGDRLLVMERIRDGEAYFVLPGGGLEPGESPREACVREVREETGLTLVNPVEAFVHVGVAGAAHVFRADQFTGSLALGGPELERSSPRNSYALRWIDRHRLAKLPLRPLEIKSRLVDLLADDAP